MSISASLRQPACSLCSRAFGFILAAAAVCFCHPQSASAQTLAAVVPLNQRSIKDLQEDAISLASRGRRFDIAVDELTEVVRREPTNEGAKIYLGSALASRANVLARYMDDEESFDARNRNYEAILAKLQYVRSTPQNSTFGDVPLPPQPNVPKPIDGSSCKLTPAELPKAMGEVVRRAEPYLGITYSEDTKQFSSQASSSLSASQLNLRAWSKLLLRIGPCARSAAAGENKAIMDSLYADLMAAQKDDNNARQKQSVGDALVLSCVYPRFRQSYKPLDYNRGTLLEGLDILSKVAAKASNRAEMWFFIGANQMETSPADALSSMEQAASYNHDNALYPYACASALAAQGLTPASVKISLGPTPLNEAYNYIRRGSACSVLALVSYTVAAPSFVRWAFHDLELGSLRTFGPLMILIYSKCSESIGKHDYADACACADDAGKLGLFLLHAASTQEMSDAEADSCFDDGIQWLSGAANSVAMIKMASPDKTVTSNVDYYLNFLPEDRRKWLEARLHQ